MFQVRISNTLSVIGLTVLYRCTADALQPVEGGSAPQPAGLFSHVVGFRAAAARAGGVYTLAGLAEPA